MKIIWTLRTWLLRITVNCISKLNLKWVKTLSIWMVLQVLNITCRINCWIRATWWRPMRWIVITASTKPNWYTKKDVVAKRVNALRNIASASKQVSRATSRIANATDAKIMLVAKKEKIYLSIKQKWMLNNNNRWCNNNHWTYHSSKFSHNHMKNRPNNMLFMTNYLLMNNLNLNHNPKKAMLSLAQPIWDHLKKMQALVISI